MEHGKKLLVVNKQDPSKTKYINPKMAGLELAGRNLDNLILIDIEDGDQQIIHVGPTYGHDQIQHAVNCYLNL